MNWRKGPAKDPTLLEGEVPDGMMLCAVWVRNNATNSKYWDCAVLHIDDGGDLVNPDEIVWGWEWSDVDYYIPLSELTETLPAENNDD